MQESLLGQTEKERVKYYNTTKIIQNFLYKILQYYSMKEDIVTSMRISKEIWSEAKKCALERDLNIREFVESAILHEIQNNRR